MMVLLARRFLLRGGTIPQLEELLEEQITFNESLLLPIAAL